MATSSGGTRKFWASFTASALGAYAVASSALHLPPAERVWQPISSHMGEQLAGQMGAQLGKHLSQLLGGLFDEHLGQYLPSSQPGFSQCAGFFPQGKPPQMGDNATRRRELCFGQFAVLHDGRTKTPVFVAERLNRATLIKAKPQTRTDRFYSEARLPLAERATLDDYQGSGWARGHMAPAADMASPEAMAQSFSLANMVPQNHTQNAGPWARIEQDTRQYVLRAKGDVFVFTGPVFSAKPKKIGNGVAVPSHIFKLVHDAHTGRSWVHWQANRADARADAPISYAEFVHRTGLDVLNPSASASPRAAQPDARSAMH
jgi:endonuclease G